MFSTNKELLLLIFYYYCFNRKIGNNKFKEIPQSVLKLRNLTQLDIAFNSITFFPDEFISLADSLQNLYGFIIF